MNIADTIVPRSDQVNADDLIPGPMTVTVDHVSTGAAEQPIDVHLVETPGRAYRPSKGMRRVLGAAWGLESDVWTGRRMTLYREGTIRFGKDEVGGIRISHLSDIPGPLKIALTITRGKRETVIVQPLTDAPATIPAATNDQRNRIVELLGEHGITGPDACLAYISDHVRRPITSSKDLNRAEAASLIGALEAKGAGE